MNKIEILEYGFIKKNFYLLQNIWKSPLEVGKQKTAKNISMNT